MRQLLCMLVLVVAGSIPMNAQKKLTVTVTQTTTYEKILPADMLYAYSDFKPGKLYYKEGGGAVSRAYNFSLISGNCLFKDKSGNILEVVSPEKILVVVIDSCRWYRVNEFFGEVIYSTDSLELVRCKRTRCANIRREGAFGTMSSTTSMTNINSYRSDNSVHGLSILGAYDFETTVEYFLKKGEQTEAADAKGLRKLFPERKDEINKLLKSKKVDFEDEGAVLELVKQLN